MRRAATSLGALVVSLTAAMAATTAQQKHPAPPAVHAHATTAPSAVARRSVASPGLAKAHSSKNKAAPKHASGRAKGSHAKQARSRTVQAHVRPKADDAGHPRPALQFHGYAAGIARTVRRRSRQASIWRIHRMVRAGVLALRL